MKVRLQILLEEKEKQHLEEYCEITGRTKTDVLREFIRGLKLPKKPS